MLPFQIKVCGISKPEDAICACEAGADAIGLNFYEKSVRFVSNEQARRVVEAVAEFNASAKSNNRPTVKTIGVFVNKPDNEIVEIQKQVGLDGIQLHGDEQPGFFSEIDDWFGKGLEGLSLCYVRAIRLKSIVDPKDEAKNSFGKGHSKEDHDLSLVSGLVKQWTSDSRVSVLIDAHVPGEFGGTGKTIDWNGVPRLVEQSGVDLVLAGGLNPWNVKEAIETSKVKAVDVASGVESIPGVKDRERIQKFIQAARKAFDLQSL